MCVYSIEYVLANVLGPTKQESTKYDMNETDHQSGDVNEIAVAKKSKSFGKPLSPSGVCPFSALSALNFVGTNFEMGMTIR